MRSGKIVILCKAKELGNIVKMIIFLKRGIGAAHEIEAIYLN